MAAVGQDAWDNASDLSTELVFVSAGHVETSESPKSLQVHEHF